ncbi:hypothetical protein ACJMQP_22530, partial [Rhodopseudomonas palustris]
TEIAWSLGGCSRGGSSDMRLGYRIGGGAVRSDLSLGPPGQQNQSAVIATEHSDCAKSTVR